MDRYVVEELLGIGGMGAVVAARRTWDNVRVAIKVMLAAEAKHEDSTRRFFREARAAGVIDSAHVAKLLDFGRFDDGTPFMVLELLHGEGLDEIIRARAPMPIEEAVDLTLQAAEGVAEAHARGIVHRDIKPSNLFVTTATDGSALLKVLDFGISKAPMKLDHGTDAPSLTETNTTLGSPQYMSPEQLKSSKDVDGRADIWSLGLILYKLLTGRPAFEAPNVGAHFAMILADPPTRLRERRPDAPQELDDAIWSCLEKERENRWQDFGQLARAIAPFGNATAPVRAQRITAILDFAGVSSTSRPRVVAPDAPTIRESPRSKRPPPMAAPPPSQPPIPAAAPVEIGELTKSTWSPVTGRMGTPARRLRRILIGVAVAALVVVAFGAGRLVQDDVEANQPRVVANNSSQSPPARAEDNRKVVWLEKVRAGTATTDERRMLEALCILEGDDACVKLAKAAVAPGATGSSATSKASSAPAPRSKSTRRSKPSPVPEPAAADPAPSDPKPKIKPKGPMVDTL